MNGTLVTETTAATTTEGQAASQSAASTTTEGQQAQGAAQTTQQQQATSTQTTEAKPAEGASTESEQAKPPGAPDKYEFKAAEGQPEFDPSVITQFSEVAKELNLPQDAAQKVLDKMAPVLAARQTEAIEAAKTQWADSTKADKELGGDKLDENLGVAKKALEQLGTPELSKLLKESGLGNHPEIVRVLYRAGKAISEDSRVVTGQGSQTGQQSMAQRMYPNMNP